MCSNMSTLTKDKPIRKKKNKVEQFLNMWKDRKDHKTRTQQM